MASERRAFFCGAVVTLVLLLLLLLKVLFPDSLVVVPRLALAWLVMTVAEPLLSGWGALFALLVLLLGRVLRFVVLVLFLLAPLPSALMAILLVLLTEKAEVDEACTASVVSSLTLPVLLLWECLACSTVSAPGIILRARPLGTPVLRLSEPVFILVLPWVIWEGLGGRAQAIGAGNPPTADRVSKYGAVELLLARALRPPFVLDNARCWSCCRC